jgi:hypothetical protein
MDQEDVDSIDTLQSHMEDFSLLIKLTLGSSCLFHQGGYWTYGLCSLNEFAQFNGDPQKYSNNELYTYVLGRGNPSTETPELQVKREYGTTMLAYLMNNGSICDVTGRPRTVEVQFVCDMETAGVKLHWVKEYRTCHYLARVSIPQLCDNQLMKLNGESFAEITCKRIQREENMDQSPGESKIGLSDYHLSKFNKDLFVAKSRQGGISVFIDINDDHDDLISRIGSQFFVTLQNGRLVDASESAIQSYIKHGFEFGSHVYDKNGQFVATVKCDSTTQDGKPAMVVTTEPNYQPFEKNFILKQGDARIINEHEIHDEL